VTLRKDFQAKDPEDLPDSRAVWTNALLNALADIGRGKGYDVVPNRLYYFRKDGGKDHNSKYDVHRQTNDSDQADPILSPPLFSDEDSAAPSQSNELESLRNDREQPVLRDPGSGSHPPRPRLQARLTTTESRKGARRRARYKRAPRAIEGESMANTSSALALALGAGGGLALWYLLRDNTKNPASESAAPVAPAAPAAPPTPTAPARQAAPAESSPVQRACMVRLDAAGLTVDGARVGIAEALQRCKLAGLAAITVSKDASAAAYADLMIALGRAGVPAFSNRNGPRNARSRAVDDIDLSAFARTVRELAEHVEPDPNPNGRARGRFGRRKVFIAAIRRALAVPGNPA